MTYPCDEKLAEIYFEKTSAVQKSGFGYCHISGFCLEA
jgi:hypothetical protein